MKRNVLNKTNRQIIMYTSNKKVADRSFPIPPRGVKIVDVSSTELTYIKDNYRKLLLVR